MVVELLKLGSQGRGGGNQGRGVISECELSTGAGAFVQPLAECANNRERDCSSEILVLKFTHS